MNKAHPTIFVPPPVVLSLWETAGQYRGKRSRWAPDEKPDAMQRLDGFGFCGQWATAQYLDVPDGIDVRLGGDGHIEGELPNGWTWDAKWTEAGPAARRNKRVYSLMFHPGLFVADVAILSICTDKGALESTLDGDTALPSPPVVPETGLAIELRGWITSEVFRAWCSVEDVGVGEGDRARERLDQRRLWPMDALLEEVRRYR